MAAYLLGARSAGVSRCDLLRMGAPVRVCQLAEAATPEPAELLEQRWTRLRRDRRAALLYAADLADGFRAPLPAPKAGNFWPARVALYAQARDLAADQRLPPAPVLDAPSGPPRRAGGDPQALHRLLAEADAERYGSPRWRELHAALYSAMQAPSTDVDLRPFAVDPRAWVRALALRGLAHAGPAGQATVEAALDDPEPAVVAAGGRGAGRQRRPGRRARADRHAARRRGRPD
jgi:hypothetical protein